MAGRSETPDYDRQVAQHPSNFNQRVIRPYPIL